MTDKDASGSIDALHRFARACLDAHRHPGDCHRFIVFTCPTCGFVPLSLTIEHHTGSSEGDFKGRIDASCWACEGKETIFRFTGPHRTPLRHERPVCACGGQGFFVAMVERIEGARGLEGFFDEGVVVGECSRCGRHSALVYTD